MRKNKILISLIISLLLVVGCNWKGKARMPGIDIPLEDMNNELHLSAPPEINTFKTTDNCRLVLVNSSDTPILLPQDYGVHIFQYVDGKWESIENRFDYPSGEKEVLPRDNQPFREVVLAVHPFVLSDQPVTVRVVVVGNFIQENGETGKQVGAFIDIDLNSKQKTNGPETDLLTFHFGLF
jgi:hypothetical protein